MTEKGTSEPHIVGSEYANETNDPQGRLRASKADPAQCKHDWQYDFEKHIHACFKCGIPAPPNWNEVGF